jgi:hypothetical protein
VAQRVAALGHALSTEVELGRQRVVLRTVKGQVLDRMRALLAEGFPVMKLEQAHFAATFAALIDIATATAVALEDRSAHRGRNVSARPLRW